MSIRNLRQIVWFRLALILVVVFTIDNDGSHFTKKSPSLTKDWGVSFISKNQLNQRQAIPENILAKRNSALIALPVPNSVGFSSSQVRAQPIVKKINSSFIANGTLEQQEVKVNTIYERETSNYLAAKIHKQPISTEEMIVSPEFTRKTSTSLWSKYSPSFYSNSVLTENNLPMAKNKWYLYANIGPQLATGFHSEPSIELYQEESEITNLETKSGGISSTKDHQMFGVNVGFGYRLNAHWDVVSGINYTQRKETVSAYYDSEVYRNQIIVTSVASENHDGTKSFSQKEKTVTYKNYFSDTLQAQTQVSFIEIPLMVRYNWGKNRWNFFVNSGVSGIVSSHQKVDYSSNEIGSGSINKSHSGLLTMSFKIGGGVEYKILKDVSIQLTPQYGQGFYSEQKNMFEPRFQTFGIFAGLRYSF